TVGVALVIPAAQHRNDSNTACRGCCRRGRCRRSGGAGGRWSGGAGGRWNGGGGWIASVPAVAIIPAIAGHWNPDRARDDQIAAIVLCIQRLSQRRIYIPLIDMGQIYTRVVTADIPDSNSRSVEEPEQIGCQIAWADFGMYDPANIGLHSRP